MKARLLQVLVLTHADTNKPLVLHTDASEVVVGATSSQLDEQRIPHLIACRSKKLNAARNNYPVHKKEMLSSIQALDDWIHYLFGSEIHVFTDNSAIRYLQHDARPSTRQVRWLEKRQHYALLKIVHIPGKANTAADALSRRPCIEQASAEGSRLLDAAFNFMNRATPQYQTHLPPLFATLQPGELQGKSLEMSVGGVEETKSTT